ncbi:MAG: hypothetical protein RLZZ299_2758 [Pseudomonadota bacterium]
MERQNRILTILSLLLLVLVAVVVLTKAPERDAGADGPPEHAAFPEWTADDVVNLELASSKGTLAFARVDGAWSMKQPKELPVEDRKVAEVVERLVGLKVVERELTGPPERFELGAPTRVKVTLTHKDGRSGSLWVGRDAPVGYDAYLAETDGGPVRLGNTQLQSLVRRTADDFRTRLVWKMSPGGAKRIVFERAGTIVTLRKDEHGWWLAESGVRADGEAVEEWLGRASGVAFDSFLDDVDLDTVGLAHPSESITVEDAGGVHVLRFGTADTAGTAAQGDGPPGRVGATGTELPRYAGWEATQLLPVRRWEIERVEIAGEGHDAVFVKVDGAWRRDGGGPVEGMDRFFDALSAVKADRTRSAASPGEGTLRVTVGMGEGRAEAVRLGAAGRDGMRAAQETSGGPAFWVADTTLQALFTALPR